MLIVKYQCGLREKEFETTLSTGKNKLKDLKRAISEDIRVKPHLLTIIQNEKVLEDENEIVNTLEFYQVNVISELKLFNFLIASEGGKYFECNLEENDLLQDLLDQVDGFLKQIFKEQYDTYELFQIKPDQQMTQIQYEQNRNSIIGDIFQDTNVQIQFRLVHEILTLGLLDSSDNRKDIEINRNKTLLDLKELIRPNLVNFKIIINGKFPAQDFDERLIKDVFQHKDTIFIIQVHEQEK
ncbi:unnamed protein product [Paramecium pentaurelia]|uniref:Ubiquitin-like domain-containing protein n=1 Tax=Paramecium pentaurelia TaxID=43138 RepID=A0A8S1XZX5_9CILI|nr:unnamed protein product [Paramecium pentaurelia]